MGWRENTDYLPSNPFFSKISGVTYFETMLVEILRVVAFQRCMACGWTALEDFSLELSSSRDH